MKMAQCIRTATTINMSMRTAMITRHLKLMPIRIIMLMAVSTPTRMFMPASISMSMVIHTITITTRMVSGAISITAPARPERMCRV
jgi:hypothetical protein